MKKQKYYPENFPIIFFLLGLMTQAFVNVFDNWVSWLIILAGLQAYFLILMWFYYELSGRITEVKK